MKWQQRARLGVAIFGIVFAAVVYFAIGERVKPTPAKPPARVDPKATIETSHGVLNRITGAKLDFVINFDRQLAYENNAIRLIGVRIEVKEKQGRDFVITSREAQAGERQEDLRLSGDVTMTASDGFVLSTQTATFNQTEGIVRTPGPVSFSKGTMSGGGVGMTYDKNTDVLTVLDKAHVKMTDSAGGTTGEFSAGSATLARQQDYLLLEGAMHAVRGTQTIDADRGRANLTEDEKTITAIELRGNSRVAGGSAGFDSMSARDIDLDYAEDGQTIERVVLTGAGTIALKGAGGSAGQQMRGESLVIALAADGAVTSATGRENVLLDLPAAGDSAPRHVKASMLDAAGEAGKGMTSARFTDNVEYREDAQPRTANREPEREPEPEPEPGTRNVERGTRVARARALRVGIDEGAVTNALFTGRVQFEDNGLKASAAEAQYQPREGVLRLKGADEGGGPRVADEQIAIEADAIDVTLEGRKMLATANVKTLLQAKAKTPGLLKQGQPVNISAAKLEYEGTPGRALYGGGAQLWQGDTAIRGDEIAIDQEHGNLNARGNARSTLALGGATSVGRGDEIAYEDSSRQITYTGKAPVATVAKTPTPNPPAAPPTVDATAAATAEPKAAPAQLSGPQGDLQAERIVVQLAKNESRMERLEAFDRITLRLEDRVATGSRMTYYAADERYVLSGPPTAPVKVVEPCRETVGKTLTFFKSADRIIVDGNEEIRTRTTSGGPCQTPPRH